MRTPDRPVMFVGAHDDVQRDRLLVEVQRRAWAASHGIRTPEVRSFDAGGRWMLTTRADATPPEGEEYVDVALEVAHQIWSLPDEIPMPLRSRSWRAPLYSRPVRAAALAWIGIDPRLWARTRRAFMALPATCTIHGDYWHDNVLLDREGRISVIDWEHTRRGTPLEDVARMAATLPARRDAERLTEKHAATLSRHQVADFATALSWQSLAQVGHVLSTSRAHRDDGELERWLDRVTWTRLLVADLG